MKSSRAVSFAAPRLGALLLLLMVPAFAANKQPQPFVIQPNKFAVSQPLSEILKTTPPPEFHGWLVMREQETPNHVTKIYDIPDPVTQDSSEALPPLGVTIGFNFDGMDGTESGG